jgi:NitT/TauT family transport system substrate-binding protein
MQENPGLRSGEISEEEKKMMKRISILVLFLTVIAALAVSAAEAQDKKLQKVSLILNWKVMGDHSPYYVAMKKGWFAEEGIDLEVILGQGSNFSVQSVDTGKAVFGIADAPVAITARAKGAKVKVIGIIFDKHPNCMYYWKDSGIKEPKDLVGKKVGVPAADGHKVMFPAFAKIIGIDPSKVEFINIEPAAKPAILATKRADVVFDLYTGKAFFEKMIPPEKLGYNLWADYGFNAYAHAYITADQTVEKNPELVKAFLKASYRAWEFTLKNPEEAIKILSEYQPINLEDYLGNLKLVREFFKTDRYRTQGIGYIDKARMEDTIDTVDKIMGVKVTFKHEEAYSGAFLPTPPFKLPNF